MNEHQHEPLQDRYEVGIPIVLGAPGAPSVMAHLCQHCHQIYVDPRLIEGIKNLPLVSPEQAADAINQNLGGPHLQQLIVAMFNHEEGSVTFGALSEEVLEEELRKKVEAEAESQYPMYKVSVRFGDEIFNDPED